MSYLLHVCLFDRHFIDQIINPPSITACPYARTIFLLEKHIDIDMLLSAVKDQTYKQQKIFTSIDFRLTLHLYTETMNDYIKLLPH